MMTMSRADIHVYFVRSAGTCLSERERGHTSRLELREPPGRFSVVPADILKGHKPDAMIQNKEPRPPPLGFASLAYAPAITLQHMVHMDGSFK